MAVPEAAMHQDRRAVAREHYVRPAGQVFAVQPEPEAQSVQPAPQRQLRLCILAPDAAHIEPPLFGRQDIRHGRLRRRVGDDNPQRRH